LLLLLILPLYLGGGYALPSFAFIILSMLPFLLRFENRLPKPRELVPIAVLAAAAALGRVIFAALPNIKPTSAIVIVAGMAFGPEAGFMTGATAALASNMFFGQGPYTPWQMFAWGAMGFAAGLLRNKLSSRPAVCAFGFAWGFLFGWIMDIWMLVGFLGEFSLKSALLVFSSSFYFDLTHAVSNVVFLLAIAGPFIKILGRVKIKYGLIDPGEREL